MKPRDASLSDSCTSIRCCFYTMVRRRDWRYIFIYMYIWRMNVSGVGCHCWYLNGAINTSQNTSRDICVYIYLYMYISWYIDIYIYRTRAGIYVCIYIYIYICMYRERDIHMYVSWYVFVSNLSITEIYMYMLYTCRR